MWGRASPIAEVALLAATAVIRLSLGMERPGFGLPWSEWNGFDIRNRSYRGLATRRSRGEVMKQHLKLAGLAVLLGIAASPALADDKIKIGVIVTLSGPAAALGQQVRDGFALGVKDLGSKMGGRDVEIVAVDDELKPDAAVTKA